jgi:hypothetical protein
VSVRGRDGLRRCQRQVRLGDARPVERRDERGDRDAGRAQGRRVGEHLACRPLAVHAAVFEHDRVVREKRFLYLVGDHHDGLGTRPVRVGGRFVGGRFVNE